MGLATARALLRASPRLRVQVLEKESRVAAHQSGNNSGVLHCGLHYRPGSLKALLAVEGIRSMLGFCEEHGIAHRRCGKVVVATEPEEIPRLDELERRGRSNGLEGLRRLTMEGLAEREPNVRAVDALLVPEEGVVDFREVAAALEREVKELGGTVRTGSMLKALSRKNGHWSVRTRNDQGFGDATSADFLIGCAGLHADRIATLAGAKPSVQVVPFRGVYYRVTGPSAELVRHLVYPVPDPAFPFLGVHLHRRVDGSVEAGPTAVLALAREGYRTSDVNLRDASEAARFSGLWRFAFQYPRMCFEELHRSFSASGFAEALRRLVPGIRDEDLSRGTSGVRAQAMTADGRLVEDFALVEREHDLHVLNAPSPGATASLAIGEWVGAKALERLR